jgi:hypothetical protein
MRGYDWPLEELMGGHIVFNGYAEIDDFGWHGSLLG